MRRRSSSSRWTTADRRAAAVLVALAALALSAPDARAQPLDPSRKWEILDNSFLVEESFNQERGVFQNIFTWARSAGGDWAAAFTQEWPVPNVTHQLSYTVPYASIGGASGVGDVMLNYRFQLREETAHGPALSPRLSLIVPTGRGADGLGSDVAGLQVNAPVSKQFGDVYLHANAGFTWLPDVASAPSVGGSGIWRVAPMLNLMMEALVVIDESATLSPGFRRGWNIGEHQIVLGAAVPLTRADGDTTAALLVYASYELPFRR